MEVKSPCFCVSVKKKVETNCSSVQQPESLSCQKSPPHLCDVMTFPDLDDDSDTILRI
ncbi:hypothetical protein RvY_16255 [Ramazzottius varieornatus]|uniref:Uncharacterized protein n=1 Tax=Ramazzottius varieornatus TaxID=947166 RepID=A0A1D1W4B2_RAMVA|nr:hypothetical protein RvY_16255 [Ramazzottius varieornatus]